MFIIFYIICVGKHICVCVNRGQTRKAKKIEKWPVSNGVLEYIFRVYKVNEKTHKNK